MALFARGQLHPRNIKRALGRELTGIDDPDAPTGEYAVLAAINEGRIEDVRTQLAEPRGDLIRSDFAGYITNHLDETGQRQFITRMVDVPMKVWHDAAKTGREEHRNFDRVLADYMVRGWEMYTQERSDARNAREALQAELRNFRHVLEESLTAAKAGNPYQAEFQKIAESLATLAAQSRRQAAQQGSPNRALVGILAAVRKSIPPKLVDELRKDGWLA